jgi:hypothetical protein
MTSKQREQLVRKYNDFWNRAAAGDRSTLDQLKQHFDIAPEHYTALFRGDLAGRVVDAILDRVAGKDLRQREAIRRNAEAHRKELAGPCPSPIEAILAERCAVLYLAAHEADLFMYRSMEGLSSKRADHHERRRDRANKRFMLALKALALVKEKLALAQERSERARQARLGMLRTGSRLSSRMPSVN